MKTKAIVFRKANSPTLEELELPPLRADEILLKTSYSGVSIGTGSSIFSGVRTHNGTFPLVGGYMATGVVEKVGADVIDFAPGDRVAGGGVRLEDEVNSVWGGHSSRQLIKASMAVKVPEKTEMSEGAMFVMPSVGLNAIRMAEVNEQDTVLISGQGLIGQFFGQFAKNRGAKVIAIEPNEFRRALSKQYVTPYALDPFGDDVAAAVAEITDGRGPSVVVEATASAALIDNATRFLREDGKMVFLSWYPGKISIDFSYLHNNAVRAFFPTGAGNAETWRATLACLGDGAIVFGKNMTDLLPYEKACDGYRRIIDGDKSIMGTAFDWRDA